MVTISGILLLVGRNLLYDDIIPSFLVLFAMIPAMAVAIRFCGCGEPNAPPALALEIAALCYLNCIILVVTRAIVLITAIGMLVFVPILLGKLEG